MVVLFALGVMSLLWMAIVAALIFAQKVLPKGQHLTRVFAVAFVAAGIWVISDPGSVPGLTQPDSGPARMMKMEQPAKKMKQPPMKMPPGNAAKPING
jgi:hypothetical protein